MYVGPFTNRKAIASSDLDLSVDDNTPALKFFLKVYFDII